MIAAGSVDSAERIRALADRGIWGFTVGTAALDGKLVPDAPLRRQLEYILDAARGVRGIRPAPNRQLRGTCGDSPGSDAGRRLLQLGLRGIQHGEHGVTAGCWSRRGDAGCLFQHAYWQGVREGVFADLGRPGDWIGSFVGPRLRDRHLGDRVVRPARALAVRRASRGHCCPTA